MAAVERDAPDGVVRAGDGLRIARTARHDGEHAPAAGDDAATLQGRARVRHVHARHLGGGGESIDPPSGLVRSGVSARGHHDTDVRVRGDAPAGVAQIPPRRPEQHRREAALDHREDDLRLRIAEAHVELDDPWAVRRQHQTDVEHPAVLPALAAQTVERRVDDIAHDPRFELGVEERTGPERTHAAGVRPGVAVEDALVILGRRERQTAPAVGDGEEGDLRTRQALLDDDGRAGVPEATGHHRLAHGGFRGSPIRRHRDSLAGRESVGLDDDREPEPISADRIERLPLVRAHLEPGGRNAMTRHEGLGEGFARFERRRGPRRSEEQPARLCEAIGHALRQR